MEWKPLPPIVRNPDGEVRWHPVISPVIIEQDGPRTTLRWRGTDEARPLPDGATDDEIMAAVRAWEAER
jgi:hypothetical protein